MTGRWGAALAAAAVALAWTGARAAGGTTCELSRVDRARTTSLSCMTCHDGSAGKAVPFQMRGDGAGMSHPVEIDYAAAAARQPGKYEPASSLPYQVPLVAGKVQCTTCHDGASRDPMRVVEIRDLCIACHRL